MHTLTGPAKRRALLEELASRHVRLTAQRRLLLGIIQEAERHLDAAALLAAAQAHDPRVNRATVYRTLALLKKLALIDELDLMHLEGEKHFYEAKRQSDHMHLACFRCGKILEYSSPTFERLKAEIAERSHFAISVTRLEIGGLCADCRAAGRDAAATKGGDGLKEQRANARAGL
ncbi:MAG TPA: transcriptional repressor [Terriglobia bacterium]|nr:transcriptional repressor [Terriglobia bacterium]